MSIIAFIFFKMIFTVELLNSDESYNTLNMKTGERETTIPLSESNANQDCFVDIDEESCNNITSSGTVEGSAMISNESDVGGKSTRWPNLKYLMIGTLIFIAGLILVGVAIYRGKSIHIVVAGFVSFFGLMIAIGSQMSKQQ